MLTVGSLFSGIGGLELGLERAGMRVRWQVEIDEYANRVLARHWPDVARYRDVREVGAHNLEPVDLICGGFPCQDISNAGNRVGIEGERSGLWAEYARIVGELRPRYVLVENVAALLDRGMGRVLGDLAALGFDAEWDCLPAAAFGAHHIRDRAFIVAYPASDLWGASRDARPETPDRSGTPLAYPEVFGSELWPSSRKQSRGSSSGSFRERWRRWWAIEPDVGRVADGVPARVDRLRCLGNAVVPQVAEFIGRRIVEADEASH
jgi:DNA (cytosine-5)-methyltransferase 1